MFEMREADTQLTDDPELDGVLAQRDACVQRAELWKRRIAIAFIAGVASVGAGLLVRHFMPGGHGSQAMLATTIATSVVFGLSCTGFLVGVVATTLLLRQHRKLTKQAESLVHEETFIAGIKDFRVGDIVSGYRIEAKHDTLLHLTRVQGAHKVRGRNIAFFAIGIFVLVCFISGIVTQGLVISPAGNTTTNIKLQLIYWALPFVGAVFLILSLAATNLQIIVSRDHNAIILERCVKLAIRDTQLIPTPSIERICVIKGRLMLVWQGRATELMKIEEIKEPSKGLLLAKTLAAEQALVNVGADIANVLGLKSEGQSKAYESEEG